MKDKSNMLRSLRPTDVRTLQIRRLRSHISRERRPAIDFEMRGIPQITIPYIFLVSQSLVKEVRAIASFSRIKIS